MLKAAIVLMLIATVVSLFSGLFFSGQGRQPLESPGHRLECSCCAGRHHCRLDRLGVFFSGQLVSHVPW